MPSKSATLEQVGVETLMWHCHLNVLGIFLLTKCLLVVKVMVLSLWKLMPYDEKNHISLFLSSVSSSPDYNARYIYSLGEDTWLARHVRPHKVIAAYACTASDDSGYLLAEWSNFKREKNALCTVNTFHCALYFLLTKLDDIVAIAMTFSVLKVSCLGDRSLLPSPDQQECAAVTLCDQSRRMSVFT